MALFKISKGNSSNLPTLANSGDGYSWFTYDDGKFYIDYQETANGPLKRRALNAVDADAVLQNTTSSTNTNYRILLSGTATNNAERSSLNKAATLQYNPSTDLLSTGNIELTGDLEVAGNVDLSGETTVDSLTTGNLQVNGAANFVNSPTAPTPAAASNNTTVATTAFVVSAINTLDGTLSGSPGASKTLTAFSQENGKISATFGDINITKSQVSDFSHSHGNITNAGELSTANRAVITDGNKKITISSVTSTELGYLSGVTSAIQAQLNAKAPLANPALTGTPTAPTAAAGTNTTQIATTAFVQTAVSQGFAANDAMVFKGILSSASDFSTVLNSNYSAGWTYRSNGSFFLSGSDRVYYVEPGDLIICVSDKGSTSAVTDWRVVEHNIDGALYKGDTIYYGNKVLMSSGTSGAVKEGAIATQNVIKTITWNAGTVPTLGPAIEVNDITTWNAGSVTTVTVTNGVITVAPGTASSLSYTRKSIPNVTNVGTAPSLTTTNQSVMTGIS